MKSCLIGIDVGLTSVKAAAFNTQGVELSSTSAPNPRVAVSRDRQEIDMITLWDVVSDVVKALTRVLNTEGWQVSAIGVTGHGNGVYLVDEHLRPTRPAIASTDERAAGIVASIDPDSVERVRKITGSVPWAGQAPVLLRWLQEFEPSVVAATRWVLTCKDWINACLTGVAGTDYSDASACGLVRLATREYEPAALDLLDLSSAVRPLLPRIYESDEVVGQITATAAARTGLEVGTPVVAGCTDCAAIPLGTGATQVGDVTITVGTWAINSVVVPVDIEPPQVTINTLLPDPKLMLAMEVAPTSAASIEWAARLLGAHAAQPITPRELLDAVETVPAGSDGLLFLPFIHGAPEHGHASAAILGIKDTHGYPQLARAVAEGITQYHRVQVTKLLESGAQVTDQPWTLAGGGAKNRRWAQMFADILGHPIRRQLGTELGARGVAFLAARSVGIADNLWFAEPDPDLVVSPGSDCVSYTAQSHLFNKVLRAMHVVWDAQTLMHTI